MSFFEKPKFNNEHVCNKEACVNIMLVQINVDKFWFEVCSKLQHVCQNIKSYQYHILYTQE